jgi:hypothetical protein
MAKSNCGQCGSPQGATCQPFPPVGTRPIMNLDLADLRDVVGVPPDLLRCYIVKTIEDDHGRYRQTGCSPNWQGGVITLCACKHLMRTWLPDAPSWEGTWIAGVTRIDAMGDRRNNLVFLMRVCDAFESQRELWEDLPDEVRRDKSAHDNICGEVYKPRSPGGRRDDPGRYDPGQYLEPHPNHVHNRRENGEWVWHKDIRYGKGCGGRQPALLLGDTERSFLWSKPRIFFPTQLPRTKEFRMAEFLGGLSQRHPADHGATLVCGGLVRL